MCTLGLALIAVPALSQTLDLGTVTVSLGMARQHALRLLSEAGYKVLDSTSATSVEVADPTFKHVYTVQFTGQRLTYADRSWLSENIDGLDAAIKALGALAQKGPTSCSISYAPITEPDTATDRVFVKCGQRGVLMFKGKLAGIDNMHEVSEFIGVFNARLGR